MVDHRVDIYALGVSFYWLVTGTRPFRGINDVATLHSILNDEAKPPSAVNHTLPKPVDDLIMAMIAKDPNQRIQDAGAVYTALEWAFLARNRIVAPFVQAVMASNSDEQSQTADESTTNSFTPSVPSLDIAKAMELTSAQTPYILTVAEQTRARLEAEPGKKRRPVVAIAAGAGTGIAALVAAAIVFGGEEKGQAPPPPPSIVAQDPPPPPSIVAQDPPPPPPSPEPDGPKPSMASTKSVELLAPSGIRWLDARGTTLGSGNARGRVRDNATSVIAVDTKRGGKSTVPIRNGIADYHALPKGKLQVRAFPFAEVMLGSETIGVTPFPDIDLVAGEYTVRLKYEKKIEKRKVTIKGGATERVTVRFE